MTEQGDHPSFSLSRTAVWVAAGRAVGAREPDEQARNPDFLAERLLGDLSYLDFEHPVIDALNMGYEEAMQDIEVVTTACRLTVRTRYIDEALQQAIADGVTQVVILGAGYDTHAYRFLDLLARTRLFEVDRPAMQAVKRQRVIEALGGPPSNLTYVAIDFQHEDLPEIMQRFYDMTRDEPWIYGFPLEAESEYLGALGLELREKMPIGGEQADRRFLTRADGSIVGAETVAAAMARMMKQAREAGQAGIGGAQMSPERMRELQRHTAYQLAVAVVN